MRLRVRPLEKKYLRCLRCGKLMWTDAARRFCRKCRRHNFEVYDVPIYTAGADAGDQSY